MLDGIGGNIGHPLNLKKWHYKLRNSKNEFYNLLYNFDFIPTFFLNTEILSISIFYAHFSAKRWPLLDGSTVLNYAFNIRRFW